MPILITHEPEDYEARVQAYEGEGLTRSDAQAVVDAEILKEIREATCATINT